MKEKERKKKRRRESLRGGEDGASNNSITPENTHKSTAANDHYEVMLWNFPESLSSVEERK